jgi:hypothetical protein
MEIHIAKLKHDLARNPAVVAFGVALGYICGIARRRPNSR